MLISSGPRSIWRLFWLVFGLIWLACLSACQPAAVPEAHEIRFGLSAMPVSLDPRRATDATSYRINRLLYESLTDFDEHYHPIPKLADWKKLGPTHYRFTLKHPLHRFHDGQALTARDVKATYESILDSKTGSPHRGGLRHIKDINIKGQDTIDFFLNRPDPLFPGRLTLGILPADKIRQDHPFAQQPIGSGGFRYVHGGGAKTLRIERLRDQLLVDFFHVPDPTVRVLKLRRGEINLLQNDLPREMVVYLRKQNDIQVETGRGTNFTYLGFNLEDATTRSRELREAISLALNREEIINGLLAGAARPATSLLPPDHWAGNPDLPIPEYNPERARELLSKSGLTLPVHLTYKTSSNPFRIRIATLIQHQLAQVGIDVTIKSYDWGTFYGDIKAGRFQMFSLSWVGIKTPDIFRYVFHQEAIPPKGANRGRYRNPEVDRLIEQADAEETLPRQAELYRRIQAIILKDLPYVPLWYEDHFFAARSSVTGYHLAPDGNYDGLKTVVLVPHV